MVRVIIKGGVWRNTEDEILKAAIMKYGKNQWSRIASLLHRKSAKQCKARWFEWLDPGIKKTEWARDEDEKLLHLAKLMPTQWRTIAPIVGRTAAQCLERYEHLLDNAQKRAERADGEEKDDARRLKPGELDPTPETKPARPDPIDMDEDELEMLSEARARLANTQGKKAKRKAREKQLAEARRLASLQKRRELRTAGISWGNRFGRSSSTHINYNAGIPFEKPVPLGFYDPSEDKYVKDFTFKRQTRSEIEGPKRDDIKGEERRKDREKLKRKRLDDNFEQRDGQKFGGKKRSNLVLPPPQISEKELEDIIKVGQTCENVKEMSDGSATSLLLHDYESARRVEETARTPSVLKDALEKEAENILALQNAPTPLKGGVNTPLHDLGSVSSGQQTPVAVTPNTLLTSFSATPRYSFDGSQGKSELRTPAAIRDELSINYNSRERTGMERMELSRALSELPAPKNDFEIVMPNEVESFVDDVNGSLVEDASEVDLNRQKENEYRRIEQLKKESHVLQRSLPIPSKLNEQFFKPSVGKSDFNKADDMVKSEMLKILLHDVEKHPIEEIFSEDLEYAEKLIEDELGQGRRMKLNANLWNVIEQCSSELIFTQNKFTRLGVLPKYQQIDALNAKFQTYRAWMNNTAKKVAKCEKRLRVKLHGYQSIMQSTSKLIAEVRSELEASCRERRTFELLRLREEKSANKRLGKLIEEVEKQNNREKELQERYAELLQERQELEKELLLCEATITSEPVTY